MGPDIGRAEETGGESTDSTSARDREAPKRSFGKILLAVPGEILTLPVYTLEGIVYGGVYLATETPLRRALNFGNPISPFYPVAGYNSNSGIKGGGGVNFYRLFMPGDRLKLKASYSTNRYQSYRIKYDRSRPFGGRSGFKVTAEYKKRPRESFYGPGNLSREDEETNFTLERSRILAELTWRSVDRLTLIFTGGFTAINTFDGRNEDSPRAIDSIIEMFSLSDEYFRSTRFITIGGGLSYDRRDHPGQPSSGGQVRFEAEYNKGTGRSDDLDFLVSEFEAAWYMNLFRRRILALKFLTRLVDAADNKTIVPFYLMSTLGGQDDLRGYKEYRFVDEDMTLASAEYRYPIFEACDAFLFVDAGRVFGDVTDDFKLADWQTSFGLGIRIWNAEGVLIRTQVAISREATHFYLEWGSVW